MADITISDLELAPTLTDDMVLPVENTTDTYAATLAMLRRLINKTFVEVANADFNDLTDDGFYQCTGTPTNSPEAGAINWTLQVSAESGVVVQRAFSLDDSFANLYIRRWNGVTWTVWLEVGAGALDNKANISLSNLDATGQAKFDAKANTDLSNCTRPYLVETWHSGSSWYRVWSDGFIEQGGYAVEGIANVDCGLVLLKPYTTTDYTLIADVNVYTRGDGYSYFATTHAASLTHATVYTRGHAGTVDSRGFTWRAVGY